MSTFRRLSEIAEREQRHKVYGVVVGIVTNNKDDSGKYRVKVRFPWLPNGGASNAEESDWCRIACFMAGKGRGSFFLPEVDDEVLVAFEHGDIGRPYVVGALWNGKDTTTYDNKGGKNNLRAFTSRSGHLLEFCDDKDNKKEKITVKSAAGARIVIDDAGAGKKIEIYDDGSKNYILIDVKANTITINSEKDIKITAKDTISLKAKTIETESDADTKMKVGANFEMKASSNMTMKASGQGELNASGTLTVKGATVNIN